MEEHATTPDGLWITSWLVANAPWLIAGCLSGAVRLVYLWGRDRRPFRFSISEAFICGVVVAVMAPVAATLGLDKSWAMVCGVAVGLIGSEAVRSALMDRIAAAAKTFFKGK